jgi:hypothetical protein
LLERQSVLLLFVSVECGILLRPLRFCGEWMRLWSSRQLLFTSHELIAPPRVYVGRIGLGLAKIETRTT